MLPPRSPRLVRLLGVLIAVAAIPLLGNKKAPAAPVQKLVPGEILRYRVEYRSAIQAQSAGPIYNPEASHRLDVSLSALVKLDVLTVATASPTGPVTRLRATYESSDARVESDAYDPGADVLEKQYRDLEGRSFDFNVDAQGRLHGSSGLDRLQPDDRVRNAMVQWFSTVTGPPSVWQPGMRPGRKWRAETPFVGAPLAGLAWRTDSVYRDNEPCPPAPGAMAGPGVCAVISTNLETVERGPRRNSTPPDYLRQGLRTSGHWKSRGASLSYVSLSSGLVTSSTATENDDMDFTIASAQGGSRLHYAGQVQSTSQITLVGLARPSPPKSAGAASGSRNRDW